ncbi:PhnB 3-demethylubiquinone-9 3-methyltransferase [Salmonella sp. NCTC 11881]|nr:PhnB 3-demethylubiquinone-9 3-methyltransferase [Salmonella sp. NCTC 11881]
MPLSPYLSFAGNCADAIAYYQQTLGAELLYKLSFGEMPPSAADNEEGCPSGMRFSRYSYRPRQHAHCRQRYHDE